MTTFPLWANIAAFAVAAAMTWVAGARLAADVDELAERTGAGRSFLGALVLGGMTSLPEAATVTTAAAVGGGSFALGNILGSASANVAILAAGDVLVLPRPLLDAADRDAVQRQSGMLILLLAVTTCGILAGEPFDIPVGLWTASVAAGTVAAFLVLRNDDRGGRPGPDVVPAPSGEAQNAGEVLPVADERGGHLAARLVVPGVVIVVAGYAAARAGTAIADQTGLSSGFVGFALLSLSTSLPEMSTTVSALRLGSATMALGNVLGTNIFNHVLVLPADIADGAGPLFASMDPDVAVGAAVAIAVVGLCVAGLARPRRIEGHRVGPTMVLVLGVYAAGIALVWATG
ncbi:MAG: hypothetical protein KY443_04720 [Actinobacteria bacterium]|nr:hypothetical protein [Actinomycetota bacterium]